MEQSPRILAPRINDSLWEHHRDAIERLYIAENRKLSGQDGVMEVMAREYSFFASKTQYEARFKHWKIRKKITEHEWNAILPRIDKRANDGRETQVVFNGIVLCEERVARELARRRSSKSLRTTDTQDPKTPPGFAIQSPMRNNTTSDNCSTSDVDVGGTTLLVEDREESSRASMLSTVDQIDAHEGALPTPGNQLLPDTTLPYRYKANVKSSFAAANTNPRGKTHDQFFGSGVSHKSVSATPIWPQTSNIYLGMSENDQREGYEDFVAFRATAAVIARDLETSRSDQGQRPCDPRYCGPNCCLRSDIWFCLNRTCRAINIVPLTDGRCSICGSLREDFERHV